MTPVSAYMTWTAPALVNGVISYYTVLFNGTSRYLVVDGTMSTGSNATAYNFTYLEACATYWFAVSATIDASCTGPYSASLNIIMPTPTNCE